MINNITIKDKRYRAINKLRDDLAFQKPGKKGVCDCPNCDGINIVFWNIGNKNQLISFACCRPGCISYQE